MLNRIELTGQQLPAWCFAEEGEEWEQYDIIDQENGCKLVEVGVGVYLIEYEENGKRHQAVRTIWPEAQNLYLRKVEEADRG